MAHYLCQNFVSAQYLENHLVEFHQVLYMHSSWQDLAWDCYTPFSSHLYQSYGPWFTSKFRFRSTSWEPTDTFTNFYICIHIDKIYVGIVTHHFSHIRTRVMALDLCQNFVSLQYLENKWTEFHQILYMHSYWQDLHWDCYTSFLPTFVPESWPLIYSKISFLLNILRTKGQILTKLYIRIYTDKIYVGIVSCHFSQFVKELWPFIDVRITLPLNILRHSGLLLHARYCSGAIVRFSDNSSLSQNFVSAQYLENKLTEFHQILYYAFILTRSTLGLLHVIFRTFVPELWPLIYSKISFPLNILRTNRQISTKLYITNYTEEIYVGIVCCHFSQICKRVMALMLELCYHSISRDTLAFYCMQAL